MRSLGLPTVSALVVSLFAVSSSAALIAYAAAPALAIAFWRNALAVGVIAPVAIAGRRHQLADLFRPGDGRRAGLLSVLAGFALAGHFGTWVPSAKLTSVATATALVATQPVWAALIARLRGIPVPSATWLGVGLAVVGAALATGADVSVSGRAGPGDDKHAGVHHGLLHRLRGRPLCGLPGRRGVAARVPAAGLARDRGADRRPTAAGSFAAQLHAAADLGDHDLGAAAPRGAGLGVARLGAGGPGAGAAQPARPRGAGLRRRDRGGGQCPPRRGGPRGASRDRTTRRALRTATRGSRPGAGQPVRSRR